jgi:hypothetical protein
MSMNEAPRAMTPREMLRRWQWRGDVYGCICCGQHHMFGCLDTCELTAYLALPTEKSEATSSTMPTPAQTRKVPGAARSRKRAK